MEIEDSIQFNDESSAKYDFDKLKNGSSVWVKTNGERVNIMDAFKRWAKKNGTMLSAKSRAVSSSDPKGEGIRIFFNAQQREIKPVVISTVRKNASREGNPLREFILTFTGLETDEDVLDAVMSVEPAPQTISEAGAACRLLWTGETPLQLERCLQKYGKTYKELREKALAESAQRDSEDAERKADEARRMEEIRREEARSLAQLERELKDGEA